MSIKNPFIIDLKKTNGDVYLKIEKSKVKRFYAYARMIEKESEKGVPLSMDLFQKFLGNISFVEVDVFFEYLGLSRLFTSKIAQRFINDKNYSFSSIPKSKPRKSARFHEEIIPEPVLNAKKQYSLGGLIETAVDCIFKDYMNKRLKHKRDILIPCYERMIEYREQFKRKDKAFLSKYKITVIAAYISTYAEFPVTSNKNPSNEILFHGANPTILKALKNKEQKS